MKLFSLIILIFFTCQNIFSQSLGDEYFNLMKPIWETKTTDELRNQIDPKMDSICKTLYGIGLIEFQAKSQKEDTENKILMFKNILALNDLNENDNEITILVESGFNISGMKGFVIFDNKFYCFQQNEDNDYKIEKYPEYLKNYKKLDRKNARSVLFFLLKDNLYDIVGKIIEDENNDPKNKKLSPIVSYEILNYNSKRTKKLNLYYINEYGTIN
ncbi:hypothetical protein LNQ49_10605 [Flavobacterium sp. F-65]|uniref:Uncharacterized protein n=1 Tax=Flavobacterium pisciphilum TaxID=2893755 RepID=A0ABS8MTB8_9FLAO|nr:hypothetical protein [Flavobacterium sp. F-65]MCC9072031.1 hypothetical protein [Flavobacterium sp. F-65]